MFGISLESVQQPALIFSCRRIDS